MTAARCAPERERVLRRVLALFSAAAAALLLAQAAVMLWARHELVPYESVVAIHLQEWSRGINLYRPLNSYPYTVATYTPLFHTLAGGLCRLGAPALQAGRMVSLAALLSVLFLVWRLLGHYTQDRYARWAGALLAASTANLVFWGTVCRVDMLGLCFALAGFDQYSLYRQDGRSGRLAAAAFLVTAAAYTKQTMLVSAAVIGLLLLRENKKRAVWFGGLVAALATAAALLLQGATSGNFLAHTVRSNLNPFSAAKLGDQWRYLASAATGLVVLAAAGLRTVRRESWPPLHLYLGGATLLWLATGGKVGADLNYQIETLVLLALTAGWTLDRTRLFPRLLAGDRSLVPLLQIPLALHLVVNLAVTSRVLLERLAQEVSQRQHYAALRPYLAASPDPVLSAYQDPLLQAGRPLVADPFMFSLIARAKLADPEPLRRDLEAGRFGLILLFEDIFENAGREQNLEYGDLPPPHLEAIRRSYRLVAHLRGAPVDTYLYQPRASPGLGARGRAPATDVTPAAAGSSP